MGGLPCCKVLISIITEFFGLKVKHSTIEGAESLKIVLEYRIKALDDALEEVNSGQFYPNFSMKGLLQLWNTPKLVGGYVRAWDYKPINLIFGFKLFQHQEALDLMLIHGGKSA